MKKYIIPIFIPHYGCPHQCVFCNQRKITGIDTPVSAVQVTQIIEEHLQFIRSKREIEVAFYGGSFTALPLAVQSHLLAPAYQYLQRGEIHAIRLSTRPDCITPAIVANLKRHGVSIVELGVQSMDDKVLVAAERGHKAIDVIHAMGILKQEGLICGIQVMPGLPQEDWLSMLYTAQQVVNLKPEFTRIYPTVVIADTKLAKLYYEGHYQPLSLDAAVHRSAFLQLLFLQHGIQVIRVGLQATSELSNSSVVLDGPYHPAFGEMVQSYLFYNMVVKCFEVIQDKNAKVILHHHLKDTSKLRGLMNKNVIQWQRDYPHITAKFTPDGMNRNELSFEYQKRHYIINLQMLKFV